MIFSKGFWRLCGSLPPLWSVRYYGPWVCVARLLQLSRSLIWSALCSSRKSWKFILIFFSQCRCQNDQPYVDYYLIYHLQDFASSYLLGFISPLHVFQCIICFITSSICSFLFGVWTWETNMFQRAVQRSFSHRFPSWDFVNLLSFFWRSQLKPTL